MMCMNCNRIAFSACLLLGQVSEIWEVRLGRGALAKEMQLQLNKNKQTLTSSGQFCIFLEKKRSIFVVLQEEVKGNSSDLMYLPVQGFTSVIVYEEHNSVMQPDFLLKPS